MVPCFLTSAKTHREIVKLIQFVFGMRANSLEIIPHFPSLGVASALNAKLVPICKANISRHINISHLFLLAQITFVNI